MRSVEVILVSTLVAVLVSVLMPGLLRQACKVLPPVILRQVSGGMATRTVEPYSMAFVTAPNTDVAKKLAGGIVSNKLAACVNIIPAVVSVYEWEGKIENDSEVLMMIKTRTTRIEELTEFVKKNHPYDVCEVITTSIEAGNRQYLDWIGQIVPEKKQEGKAE